MFKLHLFGYLNIHWILGLVFFDVFDFTAIKKKNCADILCIDSVSINSFI